MGKFLYQEMMDRIINDSLAEGLRAGDKIPTLGELAAKYSISAAPVRQALKKLTVAGKITSRHGSGYYLTEKAFGDCAGKSEGSLDYLDFNAYIPFVSNSKKAELKIGLIDGLPSQRRMWNEISKSFNTRHPKLKISLTFSCNSQSLLDKLSENTGGVDILQLSERQMLDVIEEKNVAEIPRTCPNLSRLSGKLCEAVMDGDKIYGVPFIGVFPLLLINRKIMAAAGCPLPEHELNWTGFVELTKKLTAYKKHTNSDFYPAVSNMSPFNYLFGASCDFYDSNRNVFDWGHKDVISFFRTIGEIGARTGGIPTNKDVADAGGYYKKYNEDKIGMLLLANVFAEVLGTDWQSKTKLLPFPVGKGKHLYHTNCLVSAKNSQAADLAAEFLDFLLGEECASSVADNGLFHLGGCKCRRRVGRNSGLDELVRHGIFKKSMPAISFGKDNYDFISETFNPLADGVRDGEIKSEKAVDALIGTYAKITEIEKRRVS